MRIGELARRAGIGVQAIRYYERMDLLKAPQRMPSGYRKYAFEDLERVVFIRRSQAFGFSLEEIRKLAEAHAALMRCPRTEQAGAPQLQFIIDMFESKRCGIAEKIGELRRLEGELRQGMDRLMDRMPQCPVDEQKAASARCPQSKHQVRSSFKR